jgi:hypothetical protein
MDRTNDIVRLGGQKREDVIGGLASFHLSNRCPMRPHASKNARGRVSSKADQTGGRLPSGKTSFSEKLVKGMTYRFSTPSQRRQCGEETLRILVTPESLFRRFSAKMGEGIPHRAIVSSLPSELFRTMGAA